MRRCTSHERNNILKRLLIQVGAFNIRLSLRKMLGAETSQELKSHAASPGLRLNACLLNLFRPAGPLNPSPMPVARS
jgi:hypothetical protein